MVFATHISGGSRRVEEKALQDPHRAAYSDVDVILNEFQMGGLEIISASRRNGWGPDSSLGRL